MLDYPTSTPTCLYFMFFAQKSSFELTDDRFPSIPTAPIIITTTDSQLPGIG